MRNFIVLIAMTLLAVTSAQDIGTTAEVLQSIYYRCVDSDLMLSCVKPRVLAYLTDVVKQERVAITEDLAIIRTREMPPDTENYTQFEEVEPERKDLLRALMLEKLDSYISSHRLEAKLPEAINGSSIVPRSFMDSVPSKLSLPLSDSTSEQGRSFVKKVMIPFLLGLKFKATALVPLALALIALKTWKALTLGLLSMVLSGAMLIFKLSKPKVAYEVVHYGHPPVEHAAAHWDAPSNGPYNAYYKK